MAHGDGDGRGRGREGLAETPGATKVGEIGRESIYQTLLACSPWLLVTRASQAQPEKFSSRADSSQGLTSHFGYSHY